jgi:signal transduction histidine kinase
VSAKPLIERLRAHRLLGDVPDGELEWLAAHGEIRRLRAGDVVISPALGAVEELYFILSGRVVLYDNRGGVHRKIIEWSTGDVTGLLPYSRLGKAVRTALAEQPTEMFVVHGRYLTELSRECHAVTSRLVQEMLDRARYFQKEDLHQARLASLGRLAAGLAHELDNPASAAVRGAKLLVPLLVEADVAARKLGESGMSADQLVAVERLRDSCLATAVQEVRSPLEQARHEDTIAAWLDDRAVSIDSVEALAETPVTIEMLNRLAGVVQPHQLEPALRWIAAVCGVRELGDELGTSAARISELVKAVKGFSQMDVATTSQSVDVVSGLTQTLAVLRSKAKAKSVRVEVAAAPDLPRVRAVAGELNQVWSNLIENAIDAVGSGGSVEVTAHVDGTNVVVDVIDDGPGIPVDVQERIFEPFFTTKAVGEGTGLGLDIVRRLVDRHSGSVAVSSQPGRTAFRISLPVHEQHAESEPAQAAVHP